MANLSHLDATRIETRAIALSAFMRGVYQWMTLGLLLTAGAAYTAAYVPAVGMLLFQPETGAPTFLFWGLLVGEVILVLVISMAIARLSAAAASGLFLLYSLMNGLTLSSIFLVYTATSIGLTFVVCAAMFGGMSLYGLLTKRDLTSWGSFLFMGLIGILIAILANLFLQSTLLQFVISVAGVIVFTGLTAFDTQRLKVMGETAPQDDATAVRRGTILGALTLYLDFINLFLMLLRFLGSGRH